MTFVHMHDGETVYYDDACFVCEALESEGKSTNAILPDSLETEHERLCSYSPEDDICPYCTDGCIRCDARMLPEAASKPAYREPRFTWYAFRHMVFTILFCALVIGAWELVIILMDIITGSIKI